MSQIQKLLLFDIDGTLLSCQGRGMRAMHAAVQRHFDLAPVVVTLEPHGKTDPLLFEELAAGYALALDRLTPALPELQAAYALELERLLREPDACTPKPGVRALLAALSMRPGVRLGIVSGNFERTARLKLEAAGLAQHFECGGFGSDARLRADLVGVVLRRFARRGLCMPPACVWVIGDTPDDVASGRAHGTRTLAVATGRHSCAMLRACGADVVLADLTDTEAVVDILCRPG